MSDSYDGTVVTLIDEDGNEKDFEHLETIEYEGETYVALIPVMDEQEAEDEELEDEFIILKVGVDMKGEEMLTSIEDDDEFNAVAAEFERVLEDDYEILN